MLSVSLVLIVGIDGKLIVVKRVTLINARDSVSLVESDKYTSDNNHVP